MLRPMAVLALAACTAAMLPARSQALFFLLQEGNQRCFIEDVPAETLVLVEYKSPDSRAESASGPGAVSIDAQSPCLPHRTRAQAAVSAPEQGGPRPIAQGGRVRSSALSGLAPSQLCAVTAARGPLLIVSTVLLLEHTRAGCAARSS